MTKKEAINALKERSDIILSEMLIGEKGMIKPIKAYFRCLGEICKIGFTWNGGKNDTLPENIVSDVNRIISIEV